MRIKYHIWILINALGIGGLAMTYLVILGHIYIAIGIGAFLAVYGNLHGRYIAKRAWKEIVKFAIKMMDNFMNFDEHSGFEDEMKKLIK